MGDIQPNFPTDPEQVMNQHIDVPDSFDQFKKGKSKIQEEMEDFE